MYNSSPVLNSKKTIFSLGWLLKQEQCEAKILGILQKNWKNKTQTKPIQKNPTKHSSRHNNPPPTANAFTISLSLTLRPCSRPSVWPIPSEPQTFNGRLTQLGERKREKKHHTAIYVLQYRILRLNINLNFLKSPKFISVAKTQNVSLMFRSAMNKHNTYQQNARV